MTRVSTAERVHASGLSELYLRFVRWADLQGAHSLTCARVKSTWHVSDTTAKRWLAVYLSEIPVRRTGDV